MRSFIDKIPGRELTLNDIRSTGVFGISFDDVCKALKYFKDRGEHVYYMWNHCCLRSDDVDKYVDFRYAYDNCSAYISVGPITSIEDFENEIANLGDWRNPQNQAAYVKIMLQIVSMNAEGYNVPLTTEEGITGQFAASYPKEYFDRLIECIAKKFPKAEDIFVNDKLKPEFSINDEDSDFYAYLGNFNAGREYGIVSLEQMGFIDEAGKSEMLYDDSNMDMDTVRRIFQQVKQDSKNAQTTMDKGMVRTVLSDIKTAYLVYNNPNYSERLREAYDYIKAQGITSLKDFESREGLSIGAFTYDEITIFDRIDNDNEYLNMLLMAFSGMAEYNARAGNPTYGDELARWGNLDNAQGGYDTDGAIGTGIGEHK